MNETTSNPDPADELEHIIPEEPLSFGMAAGVGLALDAALTVTLLALEKITNAEGRDEGLAEGSRRARRSHIPGTATR